MRLSAVLLLAGSLVALLLVACADQVSDAIPSDSALPVAASPQAESSASPVASRTIPAAPVSMPTEAPRTSPVPPTAVAAEETWTVVNIVDGDTVDVVSSTGVQERIRLIGIDTPERGECGFGEAADALARLVADRPITLVPGARDDRDRYDRLLRYLDVGTVDAGLELIRAGHAIARYDSRDGYGRHPREDVYVAADAASVGVCDTPAPVSATSPPPTPTSAPASAPVQVFGNCAELNAVYPGGVARVGVTGNSVSGSLRPFRVPPYFDDALYEANKARDRDGDGIACEK